MNRARSQGLGLLLAFLLAASESFAAGAVGSTQTVSGGGVTLRVTYLAQSEHESRFSVAIDTHAVNLDGYNLKAMSILRDDTGLVLQPTGVENSGSGHHREVILTFPRP